MLFKKNLYFILFAFILFGIFIIIKNLFVNIVYQQKYYKKYQPIVKGINNFYKNYLKDFNQISKKKLEKLNKALYKNQEKILPNIIIHYQEDLKPISIVSPKIRSKQLLKIIDEEIRTKMKEKQFHISSQTKMLFFKTPTFNSSLSTYLGFVDKTYKEKIFFIEKAFLISYCFLIVSLFLLITFLKSLRVYLAKKKISQYKKKTIEGKEKKFKIIIEKELISEAFHFKELLFKNDFLDKKPSKNNPSKLNKTENATSTIRPLEEIIEYENQYEKHFNQMKLLKKLSDLSFKVYQVENILEIYLRVIIQLFNPINEIKFFLKSEKEDFFYLACRFFENKTNYYKEQISQGEHLYPKIGPLGQAIYQMRIFKEEGKNFTQYFIPFFENEAVLGILQINFKNTSEALEKELLFLKHLLRHLSYNIQNVKLIQKKQLYPKVNLLNESSLQNELKKMIKEKTSRYSFTICFLEVLSFSKEQKKNLSLMNFSNEKFSEYLSQYRNIKTHIYFLNKEYFSILFLGSKDKWQPILSKIVEESERMTFKFLNEEVKLKINIGLFEIKKGEKQTIDKIFKKVIKDLKIYQAYLNH